MLPEPHSHTRTHYADLALSQMTRLSHRKYYSGEVALQWVKHDSEQPLWHQALLLSRSSRCRRQHAANCAKVGSDPGERLTSSALQIVVGMEAEQPQRKGRAWELLPCGNACAQRQQPW